MSARNLLLFGFLIAAAVGSWYLARVRGDDGVAERVRLDVAPDAIAERLGAEIPRQHAHDRRALLVRDEVEVLVRFLGALDRCVDRVRMNERVEVERSAVIGNRDKSWGMRPVGEFEEGAPSRLTSDPAVYWIWSPIHFDGFCTHFLTRELPDGYAEEIGASIAKTFPDDQEVPKDVLEVEEEKMASATNVIRWKSGTRWPEGATLGFVKRDGTKLDIELEPIFRFQMMGIGYQHPEWGHAVWRDELEIGYESWNMDEVEPDDYCSIHVHNVVRAKMGDQTGVGILETIVFGRHEPSGFQDLFDGAP